MKAILSLQRESNINVFTVKSKIYMSKPSELTYIVDRNVIQRDLSHVCV